MRKVARKVTALILVLILLVSVVPFSVSAETAIHELRKPTITGLLLGREYLLSLEHGEALAEVYDAIVSGAEKLEEQVYHKEFKEVTLGISALPVIWDAYCNDHPEQFWVAGYWYGYYGELENGILATVYLKYGKEFDEVDELNACIDSVNEAVDETIEDAGITDDMTDYEKALRLHDVLDEYIEYDVYAENRRNIYGALINGQAVCEGYCESYNYILTLVGVWAYRVTGSSLDQDHAWSMVRMNGNYYHVDLTWDDTSGTTKIHNYFGLTDEAISEDHIVKMNYPLPACTATECNYFVMNKLPDIHAQPTAEEIALLIEIFKTSETAHVHVLGDDPQSLVDWWMYDSGTEGSHYYDNAMNIAQRVIKNKSGFGFSGIAQGRECFLNLVGERREMPPKPAAPVVQSQTKNSVRLKYTMWYEYSMDRVNWTQDPNFTGLKAGKTYTFYQRQMQLENSFASPASDGVTVTMPAAGPIVPKKGELTGDGEVDADDLTALARHTAKLDIITDATALQNADVTGDGEVDTDDLTKLARFIAKLEDL